MGLKEYDADMHIHGLYSGGVSDRMVPKTIAEQARLKGLSIVASADLLNPKWRKMVKEETREENGVFVSQAGTYYVLNTEIEDARRVHHLVFFPDFGSAEQLYEKLKKHSSDIDAEGRPHIRLQAAELHDAVSQTGGIIGPCHAFTPWTAMYKEYDSVKECYGGRKVEFLELGLSADTDMADMISELSSLSFLSNSDAHSPWPNKLGREFNRLLLKEPSFSELRKALGLKQGRKIILNVGLDPRLGKYHETACISCFKHYSWLEAKSRKNRCDCGGRIKKGVMDRVRELSDNASPKHPPHRPPYVHVAPLAEIIGLALSIKSPYSVKTQGLWKKYVERFGNEINILIDEDTSKLAEINERVANTVGLFREGKIGIKTGGGGEYGSLTLDHETRAKKVDVERQKKLVGWN